MMRILSVIFIVWAIPMLSALIVYAEDSPTPTPVPHQPTGVQIWKALWHAKINVRYHLNEAMWNGFYDRAMRGTSILLSAIALSFAFVNLRVTWVKWVVGGLGLVAFLLSTVLYAWPCGTWAAEDTVLAGRWNQLANNWYSLYENQDSFEPAELRKQIAAYYDKEADIEATETAARFSPKGMIAAEQEEKEYQGLKNAETPPPAPEVNKQAAN